MVFEAKHAEAKNESLSPLSLSLPFLPSNAHINFWEDASYEALYPMPRVPVNIWIRTHESEGEVFFSPRCERLRDASPTAVPVPAALVQEQRGRGAQKGPGLAQFGEETTFLPQLGLDGVTVMPVPAAAPSRRAPRGLGARSYGDRLCAWGEAAGLTERSEEPSLFWFFSNHF